MSDPFLILRTRIEMASQNRQLFMTAPTEDLVTLLAERDQLLGEVQRLQGQNTDLNQVKLRQNLPKAG